MTCNAHLLWGVMRKCHDTRRKRSDTISFFSETRWLPPRVVSTGHFRQIRKHFVSRRAVLLGYSVSQNHDTTNITILFCDTINIVSDVTRAVHSGTIYSFGLVSQNLDTADTSTLFFDTINLVSTVTRAVHSGTIYSSGLVSLQMDTADTFCILLDTKSFVSTVTRALHSGYTHIFAPTHIYSDT